MKAKDTLGLIVRLFGLLLFVYGAYSLVYAAFEAGGLAPNAQTPTIAHIIYGIVFIILGLIIARFAGAVENFCYPNKK